MRAFYRMDAELIITQVKQLNRQMQRFSNPPLLCHVNKYDLHQLKSQGPQLVWILCFPAMVVLHNSFCSCGGTYGWVGLICVCLFVFLISPNLHHTYSRTVVPARRVGGVFHLWPALSQLQLLGHCPMLYHCKHNPMLASFLYHCTRYIFLKSMHIIENKHCI